jgi:hypothetical protein
VILVNRRQAEIGPLVPTRLPSLAVACRFRRVPTGSIPTRGNPDRPDSHRRESEIDLPQGKNSAEERNFLRALQGTAHACH